MPTGASTTVLRYTISAITNRREYSKNVNAFRSDRGAAIAAIECVEHVYGRSLSSDERRSLLPEIVGMLNHLYFHERLDRSIDEQGVYRYIAMARRYPNEQQEEKVERFIPKKNDLHLDSRTCSSPISHAIPFEDNPTDAASNEQGDKDYSVKRSVGSRLSRFMFLATMGIIGGLVYWKWDSIGPSAQQWLHIQSSSELPSASTIPLQAAIVPVDTIQVLQQEHAEIPRQFTGVVKPRRASQIGFNRIGVIQRFW